MKSGESRLFNEIGEWSNRTFGDERTRGPVGPLKHLAKEVLCELLGADREEFGRFIYLNCASGDPSSLEELADVLILLMDATRRAGHKWNDLLTAAQAKHAVNIVRTYPKPVGDEISEHVR